MASFLGSSAVFAGAGEPNVNFGGSLVVLSFSLSPVLSSADFACPNVKLALLDLNAELCGIPKENVAADSADDLLSTLLAKTKPAEVAGCLSTSLLLALSMPNLKELASAGMATLNCMDELLLLAKLSDDFLAVPGLTPPHAMHSATSDLFDTMQSSQVHELAGFLNISPKPVDVMGGGGFAIAIDFGGSLLPGFGVVHATHDVTSDLLLTMQTSQLQEPVGALNLSPKPEKVVVVFAGSSAFFAVKV